MENTALTSLCFVAVVFAMGLALAASAVRVVPEFQRLLVFRMGRYIGQRGPGLVVLLPVLDRAVKVDLREQDRDLTLQANTQDNRPASMELSYTFQVIDPPATVHQVYNVETAAHKLLHNHWQALAGQLTVGDLPYRQPEIEAAMRTQLDDTGRRWGIKVTGLKIRKLNA